MLATYFALDISKASLEHNVQYLANLHGGPKSNITCAGIWGTFQNGQEFARRITGPRLFLSLGSVLCNDPWVTAIDHLKSWNAVMRPDDLLLIGMDGHTAKDQKIKLWNAYHSRDDLYRRFFLNGFNHANGLLGGKVFQEEDWELCAKIEEEPTTRHRFYFRSRREINNCGVMERTILAGEEFDWFDSHKYEEIHVQVMCSKAGLHISDVWRLPNSEFRTQ